MSQGLHFKNEENLIELTLIIFKNRLNISFKTLISSDVRGPHCALSWAALYPLEGLRATCLRPLVLAVNQGHKNASF